jgi:hypothetical protein
LWNHPSRIVTSHKSLLCWFLSSSSKGTDRIYHRIHDFSDNSALPPSPKVIWEIENLGLQFTSWKGEVRRCGSFRFSILIRAVCDVHHLAQITLSHVCFQPNSRACCTYLWPWKPHYFSHCCILLDIKTSVFCSGHCISQVNPSLQIFLLNFCMHFLYWPYVIHLPPIFSSGFDRCNIIWFQFPQSVLLLSLRDQPWPAYKTKCKITVQRIFLSLRF